MDEVRWLRRLLDACRAAKERLDRSPPARVFELGEELDELCGRFERRLARAEAERDEAA
jgi:hypothetical protein